MDKKKKEKGKIKKIKGETGSERERGGEKRGRERSSTFSLRFTKIGSLVFIRVRVKVYQCNESYAWVPKSRSFIKFQEVENFPTYNIFSLKAM